jgi:uncharacterized protein (TIGR02246 family)
MTRFVLGMVAALALAGAAQAKDAPVMETGAMSPPLDKGLAQQVQPALKAFEEAWNRHDPDAMAAMFADQAVLINPSGRIAVGRAEIVRLFEDEHERGPMKATRFSHRLTGARQIAPDVAFLDEDITISGGRDPSGRALPDQRVHGALLVARQQDGQWRVIEGRPYALVPGDAPRGVAAAAEQSDPSAAARRPQMGGTGSGAVSGPMLEEEDTAHTGP